eukprot:GHVN01073838.1.p1 GENE.GHVN01073838.1~~GHVN01073838.1.p1  ORF type:complete len:852 (-),score=161.46 GHVN01073838.1:293-2848(-)
MSISLNAEEVVRAIAMVTSRRQHHSQDEIRKAELFISSLYSIPEAAELILLLMTSPEVPLPRDIQASEVDIEALLLAFYTILRWNFSKPTHWQKWVSTEGKPNLTHAILSHAASPPPHFKPRSLPCLQMCAAVITEIARHTWPNKWVALLTPTGLGASAATNFESAVIFLAVVRDLSEDANPDNAMPEQGRRDDGSQPGSLLTPKRRTQIRFGLEVSAECVVIPILQIVMDQLRVAEAHLQASSTAPPQAIPSLVVGRSERDHAGLARLCIDAMRAMSAILDPSLFLEKGVDSFLAQQWALRRGQGKGGLEGVYQTLATLGLKLGKPSGRRQTPQQVETSPLVAYLTQVMGREAVAGVLQAGTTATTATTLRVDLLDRFTRHLTEITYFTLSELLKGGTEPDEELIETHSYLSLAYRQFVEMSCEGLFKRVDAQLASVIWSIGICQQVVSPVMSVSSGALSTLTSLVRRSTALSSSKGQNDDALYAGSPWLDVSALLALLYVRSLRLGLPNHAHLTTKAIKFCIRGPDHHASPSRLLRWPVDDLLDLLLSEMGVPQSILFCRDPQLFNDPPPAPETGYRYNSEAPGWSILTSRMNSLEFEVTETGGGSSSSFSHDYGLLKNGVCSTVGSLMGEVVTVGGGDADELFCRKGKVADAVFTSLHRIGELVFTSPVFRLTSHDHFTSPPPQQWIQWTPTLTSSPQLPSRRASLYIPTPEIMSRLPVAVAVSIAEALKCGESESSVRHLLPAYCLLDSLCSLTEAAISRACQVHDAALKMRNKKLKGLRGRGFTRQGGEGGDEDDDDEEDDDEGGVVFVGDESQEVKKESCKSHCWGTETADIRAWLRREDSFTFI